jgi:filamentous hemagglutinin family protein
MGYLLLGLEQKRFVRHWFLRLCFLGLLAAPVQPVQAQTLTPAVDGTGTQIRQQGDRIDISGGTRAEGNLFHSFEQFGLSRQQEANFLADPEVQNILGRVVGGNASIIDGSLRITGADANLFLINPAGILFGPNAQLNLPAAFTATTASGLQFDQAWFDAMGTNHYADLVGDPNVFSFGTGASGAIVNMGELTVAPGQSLTLLGGTVINTGTLAAPGGEITVMAVPGEHRVKLSHSSTLLSLELETSTEAAPVLPFTPMALPELLTGGSLLHATGLRTASDGTVTLNGSTLPTQAGTTIISGQVEATAAGQINLLGSTVGVIGADLNASGQTGGGTIRIGGDYQGRGIVPNADLTVVTDSTIQADAIAQGNGGRVILWADGTTRFQGLITARGGDAGGDGGLVETSGATGLAVTGGAVDTSASNGRDGVWLIDPSDITITNGATSASGTTDFFSNLTGATIDADTIETALLTNNVSITTAGAGGGNGDIFLNAPITSTTPGRTLTLTSRFIVPSFGSTITLGTASNLVFNLNAVNPSPTLSAHEIEHAIEAIGTFTGTRMINLGSGTYIATTPVQVNRDVAISGVSNTDTIISGSNSSRLFQVAPAVTATLQNLTLQDGRAPAGESGGAIYNEGNLTLQNSILTNNFAPLDGGAIESFSFGVAPRLTVIDSTIANNTASVDGGAIFSNGIVDIAGSTITDNRAGTSGGGIFSQGMLLLASSRLTGNTAGLDGGGIQQLGNVTVNDSVIANNTARDGGGIHLVQGDLTLTGSTIESNQATGFGGGIEVDGSGAAGTTTISNSQFLNNQAGMSGGGIASNRTNALSITDSLFSGNAAQETGGGINHSNNSSLTVARSTFASNTAGRDGGGLSNHGPASLINSTFSGNSALQSGGGINNNSTLVLDNSTVTLNQADNSGGIRNFTFGTAIGTIALQNTIVAGNSATTAPDVGGTFNDRGHNLIGITNGSTGFSTSSLVGTAAAPLDAGLAPLADNGGATPTHALLDNSPARNAGNNTNAPATDQRQQPRILDGAIDIGAFEADPVPPSLPPVISPVISPVVPPVVPGPTDPSPPLPSPLTPPAVPLPLPPAVPRPNSSSLVSSSPPSLDRSQIDPLLSRRSPLSSPSEQAIPGNSPLDSTTFQHLEASLSQDYESYFDQTKAPRLTLEQVQALLKQMQRERGIRTATIYAVFVSATETTLEPGPLATLVRSEQLNPEDQLELILVTADQPPRRFPVGVSRAQVTQQAKLFRMAVSDPADDLSYRPLAQQFYQWLQEPLEAELEKNRITHLMYALDAGLRTIPIAAMMDDQRFAIERYGFSIIPSMALLTLRHPDQRLQRTLAMGANQFESLEPLPAVQTELNLIQQFSNRSELVLNENFTVNNMLALQARERPTILHLATHAQFNEGSPQQSFIQFWDRKLTLEQVKQLDWKQSDLSLLILSACTTALGSPDAELGFAGSAVVAGVDSTIGSFWTVSDVGTLALMSEFYGQLDRSLPLSEALRRSQLALAQGQVRITDATLITSQTQTPLPPVISTAAAEVFTHPFYWAAFTLVGSPW